MLENWETYNLDRILRITLSSKFLLYVSRWDLLGTINEQNDMKPLDLYLKGGLYYGTKAFC